MGQSISDRRRQLEDAIKEVEARIAENESALKQAPSWFSPDLSPEAIPDDQRKTFKRLNRASHAVVEDRAQLDQLKSELADIAQRISANQRCIDESLRWLNSLTSPDQFLTQLELDVGIDPGGGRTKPSTKVARRVLEFRDQQPGGQLADIEVLRNVKGVDDALIGDLVFTGCGRIQPQRPVVGVLLPVRLETRFYPPKGTAKWQLRVRIIPDEPSLDRHDNLASAFELDSVEALWQAVDGDLSGELSGDDEIKKNARKNFVKNTWKGFVDRHGGGRAAWLARTFQPLPKDASGTIHIARPAQLQTAPRFGRVFGFPQTIELWMARGGKPPSRIAQKPVKQDQLTLDFPNPNAEPKTGDDKRWWSSWDRAVEVGLGIEIELGDERPDDIDALYAVGLGTDSPAALFQSHRDAGLMAVLKPGTPTNTVDGEPAADLGKDPETWRSVVLSADRLEDGMKILSRALTGDPRIIIPLPGAELFDRTLPEAMMTTLWPVLWLPALGLIWGVGAKMIAAGFWAAANVFPEGPLPPIRIGEQPYGLLPATSLANWKGTGDPEFVVPKLEEAIRPTLIKVRKDWADIATGTGNVFRANTDLLLQLLGRDAISRTYAYRYFISLELLRLLYWTYDSGIDETQLNQWWDEECAATLSRLGIPQRKYATLGWPRDLGIPLVNPGGSLQDATPGPRLPPLRMTLEDVVLKMITNRNSQFDPTLPKSLLITLTRLSLIITSALAGRQLQRTPNWFELEPVVWQGASSFLETFAKILPPAEPRDSERANGLFRNVREAAKTVVKYPVHDIERVLLATLDAAAYRIDPWITAFAWRRLSGYDQSNSNWRLGVYGWVDRPRPRNPGGDTGEFLLAPSEAQAMAAVVLRDKAINDPQPGRWDLRLESNTIRFARQLADQVRAGIHIKEVLGLEVEHIVNQRTVIDELRLQFPIKQEHEGRRVCDGEDILKGLFESATLTSSQTAALNQLSVDQKLLLGDLRRALDTYADLLMAEAAYYVVTGRGDRAGAVMDTAAGLANPPSFEVIESPNEGRSASTSVLIGLPAPDTPPSLLQTTSPGFIAEPAVAQLISDLVGDGSQAPWRWPVELPDGSTANVLLSNIKLLPVDAVMLSEDQLNRLILAVHPLGKLPTAGLIEGLEARKTALRIMSFLGSRPALPEDLLEPGGKLPAQEPLNDEIVDELKHRHSDMRALGDQLYTDLTSDATDKKRRRLLQQAAQWGITPILKPAEALSETVTRAASALRDRLDAKPALGDLTVKGRVAARDIASLISRLASPDGQMPVLSRFSLSSVQTTLAVDPTLDQNWLPAVACVRPPLARLEAFQAEAFQMTMMDASLQSHWDPFIGFESGWEPFIAVTNRPGDPWQTNVTRLDSDFAPPTKLVVVYSPVPHKHSAKKIALGLLDAWTELIPETKRSQTVAFRFNAPRARAPQAILLAVPPNEKNPMDTDVLMSIVEETRELARARMASPDDLQAYSAALPFAMLPFFDGIPIDL